MKERPIIFCESMVKALLAGRKVVTRRIVRKEGAKPFAEVGDRLWVREAFAVLTAEQCPWPWMPHRMVPAYAHAGVTGAPLACLVWRASCNLADPPLWKPSIHMWRWASRLTLLADDVRRERVQEITAADIEDEGVPIPDVQVSAEWLRHYRSAIPDKELALRQTHNRRVNFRTLWDGLNARRGYAWDTNPMVDRIAFTPMCRECGQEIGPADGCACFELPPKGEEPCEYCQGRTGTRRLPCDDCGGCGRVDDNSEANAWCVPCGGTGYRTICRQCQPDAEEAQ